MSRKLADLNIHVRNLAEQLILKCKEQGIVIIPVQTLRTIEEQNKLYAQGRTIAGKIVTNAKGGASYHNYGLAFDVAVVENGKINWTPVLYDKVGEIGKSIGLEWGGDFKKIKDKPHFQYCFGLSIKDLLSGKRPPCISQNKPDLKESDSFSQSIYKLFDMGVISSPSYWINSPTYELEYFKKLVNNFTKKSDFIESINYLADNKIINSKDYWLNNSTYSLENIKLFIEKIVAAI
jgi:hypothetical protein